MSKSKKESLVIDSQFHGSAHITKPGTNIFLDLGFSPKKAAELKLKSDQRFKEKLQQSSIDILPKK